MVCSLLSRIRWLGLIAQLCVGAGVKEECLGIFSIGLIISPRETDCRREGIAASMRETSCFSNLV